LPIQDEVAGFVPTPSQQKPCEAVRILFLQQNKCPIDTPGLCENPPATNFSQKTGRNRQKIISGGTMAIAYASFCRPMTQDTATMALTALRQLSLERLQTDPTKAAWETVKLNIACGGGDIIAGLALFTEMMAMPFEIHTHNVAAVDSAAILMFMAGSARFASKFSAFHFHQPAWTFAAKENLSRTVVSDAARWLDRYQDMMAKVVSDRSSLSSEDVLRMQNEGATLSSTEALECGVIHEIAEPTFPRDSRWHQI
jgi:ATP-dependent protease ClpP protease subunit